MAHQVTWSKTVIDVFAKEMYLSDEEIYILESRAKNKTVTEQAAHLNCSPGRVNNMISNLKIKYDVAQKLHPDIMPVRKYSKEEVYMDNH